ncbi:MAG: type II toxin-antitoxin system Phd/YefM family antitoxin [Candidatus Omnitrophica bacterium]|nr:type II toxin-antitoxin system Phd/YefM family antitoxin [Candidatus Omnitrophota bacterium]
MINTLSLKELRPALPEVIDRVDTKLDRYIVTKRGKPVVVILSVADYEALMETLDILADPEAMAGIRKGEEDIRKGRTHSWQEVKSRLAKL